MLSGIRKKRKNEKMKIDLSVEIGNLKLKNPVMTASGTFGFGAEYASLVDIRRLGAIVVKGISRKACYGNDTPRMVEVPGGLLNAIGLQNPGVKGFIKNYLPQLKPFDVPVIVNIWGKTIDEYVEVAEELDGVKGISALELNISCPNIKEGGISFGTDPKMAQAVIGAVRKKTSLPLIVKLSPNVTTIALFAKIAEDCGADAVSLINSFPAMAVDIEERRPLLANITGGLTGPAIHPIAIKMVYDTAKAVKIPIIGIGGIVSAREAIEFLIVGATAVAVGTATFRNPNAVLEVIDGITSYLKRHNIKRVKDLIGTLKTRAG